METNYNEITKEDVIDVEPENETSETIADDQENGIKPQKTEPEPKKKNLMKRFLSGLLGTRDIKKVGKDLWGRVILPNVEDIMIESLHAGIDMYFRNKMPDRHYTTYRSGGGVRGKYNYAGQYQENGSRRGVKVQGSGGLYIEPARFISKGKINQFLAEFEDDIREDGFAKVSKYFARTHQKLPDFTITNLGWYDLDDVKIINDPDPEPGDDGKHYDWLLIMPEPVKIR